MGVGDFLPSGGAMMPDDNKERQRARAAAQVKQLVDKVGEEWPMRRELIQLRAKEVYQQFVELQKAGFTVSQALELCWRPL